MRLIGSHSRSRKDKKGQMEREWHLYIVVIYLYINSSDAGTEFKIELQLVNCIIKHCDNRVVWVKMDVLCFTYWIDLLYMSSLELEVRTPAVILRTMWKPNPLYHLAVLRMLRLMHTQWNCLSILSVSMTQWSKNSLTRTHPFIHQNTCRAHIRKPQLYIPSQSNSSTP